jgi:hypothetical protein
MGTWKTAGFSRTWGAPVTVSFQNGVLPTSAYAGNTDSSIKQATATQNYGAAVSLEADGDDGSGVDKSALLRWTLSGIPAGSGGAVHTSPLGERRTGRHDGERHLERSYCLDRVRVVR